MGYLIGDVSRVLGLTASALHYYEKEGLIHKPMEDSGWRLYDEEDVYRLISVKKYRVMGVPLKEIAEQFSENGMNPQQVLRRMREKRVEAQHMAEHYTRLCEEIDDLIAAGEAGIEREGVVDIRPAPAMLVFYGGENGVIPKHKEEQALARSWLEAQPAVKLGIVHAPQRERTDIALLISQQRAQEYGFKADGRNVFAVEGGMALHAVVSCGLEQYETPDAIFRPVMQFAREHNFRPKGTMWGSTLLVDCSGGRRRYYYDTYMVFE